MLVPLGETEHDCAFCDSRVRFLPDGTEMAVVRTREEMKTRERVALAQARLRQQLEEQEAERWRRTAAKVAIAALPVLGRTAGRAFFDATLRRRGCVGCGCVIPIVILLAGVVSALALRP